MILCFVLFCFDGLILKSRIYVTYSGFLIRVGKKKRKRLN
jgi:hypothetical protein